jgi:protein gp37
MQKSKIEWCDYTINPVKGLCPMACSYCYAKRMYKRFKWNPEIQMKPDWMEELPKKPCRVFMGSTMELFGDWVEEWMWKEIWTYVNDYTQHTFIFLTKQPQNLIKWTPFPDNCWVGVSVTSARDAIIQIPKLKDITASVKFISFEPLLKPIASPNQLYIMLKLSGINWVIIGQQTPIKQETIPEVEWVEEIVNAVDIPNIPVFLKNNLDSLLPKYWDDAHNLRNSDGTLRQEFPIKQEGLL